MLKNDAVGASLLKWSCLDGIQSAKLFSNWVSRPHPESDDPGFLAGPDKVGVGGKRVSVSLGLCL